MNRKARHSKKNIVIFSDGKDECSYFTKLRQLFRGGEYIITPKDGKGQKGIRLIDEAFNSQAHLIDSNDEMAVISDYDSVEFSKIEDIKKCEEYAKSKNINFYFSNECWDLWILLHFQDVNKSLTRQEILQLLKNNGYEKSNQKTKEKFLISLSEDDIRVAISRAKNIHLKNGYINPSTNVYPLVEKIIKSI